MTERRMLVLLGGIATASALLAVAAGPRLDVAVLLGGVAALAGGAVVVLVVGEDLRRTPAAAGPVDHESLVTLRDSLHSGPLGRQRVILAVQSVERAAGIEVGRSIGAEEERRITELPAEQFRAWLSEELDRLERMT